jgi:His/Glu/Gln/Arg/opine family amino acid ABC transporter permease subunit
VEYTFHWGVLLEYRGLLIEGLLQTCKLSGLSLVLSMMLGTLVGVGRSFLPAPLRWLCTGYVELFRNIPPIVQFFFWYFAANLDVFPAAVVGLSVFTAAYIAEIVRSGIGAIPRTQLEAARSSGMNELQMIGHIVLPQALIRVIPPLSIEFINVIKNSAIAMTVGYTELTFQTQEIEAQTFRGFEAASAVTVLYIALAFAVVVAMHGLERLARLNLRKG